MDQNSNIVDFKEEQKQITFRDLLNQGRMNGKFTDVQLKIGDKIFHAHRNVLSIYSPVLEAAISDQWSKDGICEIGDEYVDVEIVEDLLSFLYTERIELTPDNVHPVCMAAHFLQIMPLLDITSEYLSKGISAENVFTLFIFSIDRQLKPLRNSCLKFIKTHHEKLLKDSQILEFSFENFNDLIEGLKDKTSEPVLRENTFHCIIRWTEKDLTERLEPLSVLLGNIPLEELPHEFLTETVSAHRLVIESISCARALIKALSSFQVVSKSPSKGKQELIVISYAGEHNEYTTKLMSYCSETLENVKAWRTLPNLFNNRSYFAVTVINQQDIIVCGGYKFSSNGSHRTNSVEIFNWGSKIWIELPGITRLQGEVHFLQNLGNSSTAALYDYLYVAGGCINGTEPQSKVSRYSFRERKWVSLKSMNICRMNGHLIPYKNYLYAIGGLRDTVERYDPALDKWTNMANMTNEYDRLGATLHRDKIYVCGENGFEAYDPDMNVWSSLPAPVLGLGTSLVSMNNKLLAVGGRLVATNEVSDLIYEFNFLSQQWIEFGKMESPSENHCAVVVQYT